MAMEYMRDELLNQLKAYGATDEEIDAWREQWRAAVESAGDPLPCPKCFTKVNQQGVCNLCQPLLNVQSQSALYVKRTSSIQTLTDSKRNKDRATPLHRAT